MGTDRIEFISEYCDRWCERCAFTSRCSAYAVQAALGMCGDLREAIELAVGAPMKVGESARPGPAGTVEFAEPTPEERQELEATVEAYTQAIKEEPITKKAMSIAVAAHQWLQAHQAVRDSSDLVIREAARIIAWDNMFIGAKLARATHNSQQRSWNDDPIQNDWNGSAKVALISIDRSEAAWQVLAQAVRDDAATGVAAALAGLRGEVEKRFPRARRFLRPGFDTTT